MTTSNNYFNPYLPTSIYLPNDYDQMLLRLQAFLTEISLKLNQRQIGKYPQYEVITGQSWFPEIGEFTFQQAFRQVYIFGAVAAGATLNIPHNIIAPNGFTFTHIYGTCITDAPDNRPLPYIDVTNVTNQILLNVTATNIVITVGATSANIVSGIIVLEYLKN